MAQLLVGLLAIFLALMALLLQRLYSFVPARELKRLAREDDHLAKTLYRAVAYGSSLRVLLWAIVSVGLSVGIILVASQVDLPLGIATVLVLLVLIFAVVPSLRLARYNAWLPAAAAPLLGWVLSYTRKPLGQVALFVNRFRTFDSSGGIFDQHDLLRIIERQAEQPGNRIPADELALAGRALRFSSLHASDILVPRSNLHIISADDSIGPVLLDTLHREGQGTYLVYEGKRDNIIGTLRLQDAVIAKQGGKVKDFIRTDVATVTDESTVKELLGVFQKTGQHFVVVLNEFEELVGSITTSALLEKLFGTSEKQQQEAEDVSITPDSSPEGTEVVE